MEGTTANEQYKSLLGIKIREDMKDVVVDSNSLVSRCTDIFFDSTPAEDIKALYAKWARTYDLEMDTCEYYGVLEAVEKMIFHMDANSLDESARILDLGCGTGFVGRLFKKSGYQNIDGLDFCPEMLNEAIKNDAYMKTYCLAIGGDELPIEAGSYDVITSVSAIGGGHIRPDALTEMLRLVRQGGLISLTLEEDCYVNEMEEFGRSGKVELISKDKTRFLKLPGESDYGVRFLWTFRKC